MSATPVVPLAEFRADHFDRCLGQNIVFLRPAPPPGERVELELIAVERKPGTAEDYAPFRVPFSLLFRLRQGAPLSPWAHTLQVDGMEACDLVLARVMVPAILRREPDAVLYEAVFG